MEIDVNLRKPTTANGLEIKTISAGSYSNNNGHGNPHSHLHCYNNNNSINNTTAISSVSSAPPPFGCCGILSRLLCSNHTRGKTATSSGDFNTYNNCGTMSLTTQTNCNNATTATTGIAATTTLSAPQHNTSYMNLLKKNHTHRRTPQEIYFESRGKSCKKLLKFNGSSNKRIVSCGILSRLLCSNHTRGKTATSSGDFNTYNNCGTMSLTTQTNCNNATTATTGIAATTTLSAPQHNTSYMNLLKKNHTHRRTPQEIYFESRGKSCKKLLKFNGSSNKILLYPEEGWARTASSSYWTITPCWWQPNRCRIEEFAGTQRQVTKAKMVPLEQKGSLLIVGHFRSKNSSSSSSSTSTFAPASTTAVATAAATSSSSSSASSPETSSSSTTLCSPLASSKDNDEFKLYLSSNISMEDYNMGYCLTGFVERRCQQTNAFQVTHFAVIKRQWPSLAQNNKNTKTNNSNSSKATIGSGGGGGSNGTAASKST